MCAGPIYLVVGIGRRDGGAPKDTALNIQTSNEFAVNLVTEELKDAMNVHAADFPPDQSELPAAGLLSAPSVRVKHRKARAAVGLLPHHRPIRTGSRDLRLSRPCGSQ